MAKRAAAVADNAPGELFVDDTCIHCGTCFTYAPTVFSDAGEYSRVEQQPQSDADHRLAAMAQIACPTGSIGGARDPRAGSEGFPAPWCPEVSFCGWTSPKSFGAWSWLIHRAQGNVLVDCPRASGPLFTAIEHLGGISQQFLTHIDDVADHERVRERFACERIMHHDEGLAVERRLEGTSPISLADDLLIIPTPGHTRGSCCLLFQERVLFTGDTLWWNPRFESLSASRSYCWYDWDTQLQSLEGLLAHDFREVLPGHGVPYRAANAGAMRDDLRRAIDRLRKV